MPDPLLARFTVGALLREVAAGQGPWAEGPTDGPSARADGPALADLLGWFRGECAALVAGCPTDAVPLRLPKARIGELLACELGTVARLGGSGLAEPIVRGRLTDLVVAQHATLGLGDQVELDLRDALEAAGDAEVLAWIEEAGDEVRARVWRHADVVAAALRTSWGTIDRAWWPRTQERVSVEVADGALVLGAQFDLALGGVPTGRPAVIIEVKAGSAADRNRRDLLWYGLLYALRHDRAPAVVATWTAADDGLVPVRVTLGSLEAAARRGLAALERLAELAAGRAPTVSPNAGCRWCPELDRCEPGLRSVAGTAPVDLTGGVGPDDEAEWDPSADEVDPWG